MTIFAKTAFAAITATALLAGSLAATAPASAASQNSYTYSNRYNTTNSAPQQKTMWRNSARKNRPHIGQPKRPFRTKRHKRHRNFAGPAAAGVVFGLAASAMAANAYTYGTRCYWTVQKRERWNRYGELVIIKKKVRFCD